MNIEIDPYELVQVVAFVSEDGIKHNSPGMSAARYGRPARGGACIERLPLSAKAGAKTTT